MMSTLRIQQIKLVRLALSLSLFRSLSFPNAEISFTCTQTMVITQNKNKTKANWHRNTHLVHSQYARFVIGYKLLKFALLIIYFRLDTAFFASNSLSLHLKWNEMKWQAVGNKCIKLKCPDRDNGVTYAISWRVSNTYSSLVYRVTTWDTPS